MGSESSSKPVLPSTICTAIGPSALGFVKRIVPSCALLSSAELSTSGNEAGGIPTGIDGLNALLIAEAALESVNSGRLVTIES